MKCSRAGNCFDFRSRRITGHRRRPRFMEFLLEESSAGSFSPIGPRQGHPSRKSDTAWLSGKQDSFLVIHGWSLKLLII